VFRSLSLVAVRQQHHHAAVALPLRVAANDELVDDHLRPVGEVAELRLPHHQGVGGVRGVAEFKAEHRRLGQQTIVNAETGLFTRTARLSGEYGAPVPASYRTACR